MPQRSRTTWFPCYNHSSPREWPPPVKAGCQFTRPTGHASARQPLADVVSSVVSFALQTGLEPARDTTVDAQNTA